ncbi:serine hydrolase domain-containing protein [Micromonospora eburnea]|uniref:CubicO group peptidase, beta-lactamase class C family n=1 Tax=Micromonospora eburnea TaxID=227316 RepID=A0A1C6TYJ5_9ACTN|nr:serine hydrolase domain-containing protein [Micromonospora eburnea]SCL46827.1 CubicO group peptidase, beta-lactamase class C family [Micromonospora eburnea]
MTRQEPVRSLTSRPVGRRSLLGLLGAAPIAVGGAWALSGSADTAAAAAAGSGSGASPVPAELRPGGQLDQLLAQMAAQDTFSGTVLIVDGQRRVVTRSYGMADQAKSVPNTDNTIFCLGSVTKMFTAVAVAQLVQQGKVAFDRKLGAYVDGFPSAVADNVTIHQLLTHTSGMGDYFGIDGYFTEAAKWNSAEQVMEGTLGFIRDAPLRFTPGTSHEYSNSGFATLGAVVAQVSGQSYYDYIRQHVFGPAGMTSSDFYTKPQWQADRRIAHPYTRQPSGQRVDIVDQRPLFIGRPDGDAFASAPDLVRFARALLDGALLNPVYTELVLSPKYPVATLPAKPGEPGKPPLPAKSIYQAYGLFQNLVNGKWAAGHNGGNAGISANIEWYPHTRWIAVKLSNYDPEDTMPIDATIQRILTQ